MELKQSLSRVLSGPRAADLWALRSDLLQAGVPRDARLYRVLGEFERFLDRLETGTSSRDYSHLASKLDIGSISGVMLEQLLETSDGRRRLVWFWYRIAGGVVTNKYAAKMRQLLALLAGERRACVVAIATDSDGSPEIARKRLSEFAIELDSALRAEPGRY